MIIRLRPKYSPEELAAIYAQPNDYKNWDYHIDRVQRTIKLGRDSLPVGSVVSVADLSAGANPDIAEAFGHEHFRFLGDFSPGAGYEFSGPIEETIDQIPQVDLFVLSETVEHLDDPVSVMLKISRKSRFLLVSTPCGEINDSNHEHYWGWDEYGFGELLQYCGWSSLTDGCEIMDNYPGIHDTQIWIAESLNL